MVAVTVVVATMVVVPLPPAVETGVVVVVGFYGGRNFTGAFDPSAADTEGVNVACECSEHAQPETESARPPGAMPPLNLDLHPRSPAPRDHKPGAPNLQTPTSNQAPLSLLNPSIGRAGYPDQRRSIRA